MAHHLNQLNQGDIQSPDDLFSFAMNELKLGVKASKHPFHLCTIATVDAHNQPHARTVVSRGIAPPYTQLRVHSDQRSLKNEHIQLNPTVSVLYYSQPQKLQVRFTGIASIVTAGTDHKQYFNDSSQHAKLCYGYPTAPGTPITESTKEALHPNITVANLADVKATAQTNFSAIMINFTQVDVLWLCNQGHVRIAGNCDDDAWQLQYVVA